MKHVLSIGTTHPWNIAGVGLDLRVGAELGVRVLTVVCAVSAQDAGGVRALAPVPPETIAAQLDGVPWAIIDAVRIGALGSADAARAVAAALAARELPVVLDPVIAATRGGSLADDATIAALADGLATLPVLLTPNLIEAQRLLGRAVDRASMERAAVDLRNRGAAAVLLKGGHLDGAPRDVLATQSGTCVFEGERIPGEMRGTGCVLAMALAVALARGSSFADATTFARAFVREKIVAAVEFGGVPAYSSADD